MVYVIRFNMVKRKTANLNIRRLRESNVPIYWCRPSTDITRRSEGYYYAHYYDKRLLAVLFCRADGEDDASPVFPQEHRLAEPVDTVKS